MTTEIRNSIPINLRLADVRQALFDEAKTDPAATNGLRYEAGRAVGVMGNAMDVITALHAALAPLVNCMPVDGGMVRFDGDELKAARAAVAKATAA